MKIALSLLLVSTLPGCFFAGLTVEDGTGAKVSFRGNMGIAQVESSGLSAGGPSTIVTGGSRGERTTRAVETQQQGLIKVGGIEIRGPIDNSTIVAERVHGVGIVSRTIAQIKNWKVVGDLFKNKYNQEGATDRAEIGAGVETSKIESAAQIETSQIQSLTEMNTAQ
tara:strand:- start:7523 stop:8023 length:501 start_codon:yes stop_codon:yes gene_type:complete